MSKYPNGFMVLYLKNLLCWPPCGPPCGARGPLWLATTCLGNRVLWIEGGSKLKREQCNIRLWVASAIGSDHASRVQRHAPERPPETLVTMATRMDPARLVGSSDLGSLDWTHTPGSRPDFEAPFLFFDHYHTHSYPQVRGGLETSECGTSGAAHV